jgi:biopolymer transport protein ExbD
MVAVKKDLKTFLNGVPMENPAELTAKVRERLEDLAEGSRVIYLKADAGLPYSEVMKIMDLVRAAGVEEVALIAEKKVQG